MAKSKYHKDFPLLAEGYAREGLNDIEIMAKLGIGKTAFYNYQEKYKEFADSLKKGKAPVDTLVENALLKRCLGYDIIETITDEQKNEQGEFEVKNKRNQTKHIMPDVGAIQTWLSNRKNHKWKRNPDLRANQDNSEELLKQIIENQKKLDAQNNE